LVGIKKQEENNSRLNIYPNPAKDKVNVSISSSGVVPARISVLDAVGKAVLTKELTSKSDMEYFQLSVHELPAGFYLLNLQQGENNITKKFVIE